MNRHFQIRLQLFIFCLISLSTVESQTLDTLDGATSITADGYQITHKGYKLEYISNATLLTNLKDEFLHRAHTISPIFNIDYQFDDTYEFVDPIEIETELIDFVQVSENYGSYLYCISKRKVVSPVLDVNASYEVLLYDENYDGSQNVTIVYKSNGKEGFYSSDTDEFSEAKYKDIYISHDKSYGVAKLYPNNSQFVMINLRDPNKIMASADEITPSNEITKPILVDYFNEIVEDSLLFNSAFFMLRTGDKYGILSPDLYFHIPPQFESITQSIYSESLLLVVKDGKYGYVDLNHRNILQPTFDEIPEVSFSEHAPFLFANKTGDKTKVGMDGETYPIDYYYQYIGLRDEDDGSDSNEWGIVQCDVESNLVAFLTNPEGTFTEDDFDYFGYYTFKNKKKYGLCSKFGEVVVPANYSRIEEAEFFEGQSDMILQSVNLRSGKKTGMYLPQTNRVIEPIYEWCSPVYSYQYADFQGWIINEKGKKGFMSPDGDVVISCNFKYLDIAELSVNRRNPLIELTTKKGLNGIANTNGDVFIEPIYESLEFYETGFNDTNWVFYIGTIDKKTLVGVLGREETVEIKDYAEFSMGEEFLYNTHCILDLREEKYGLITLNNEEIYPFEFEMIMKDSHFSGTNYSVILGYKDDKTYPMVYNNVLGQWVTKELKAYDSVVKGKGYINGEEQVIIDLFTNRQL